MFVRLIRGAHETLKGAMGATGVAAMKPFATATCSLGAQGSVVCSARESDKKCDRVLTMREEPQNLCSCTPQKSLKKIPIPSASV
jgi:hypothetical protein